MSRARELAKVGGKNQQVVAGLSSHVGVSTFASDVYMYSNLEVTGTTTFNGGTLTLGDANTDNIVFGGEVDSHIIPDDDGTYNLGSATKEWNNIFIDGTANIDALLADTAKIGDLTDNRVVIAGTSGELEDSGNLTFDGSILTTTNIVVTGDTDNLLLYRSITSLPSQPIFCAKYSVTPWYFFLNKFSFETGQFTKPKTFLALFLPSPGSYSICAITSSLLLINISLI